MSPELKKQCQAVINIINSQTDKNKEIGDQYILGIFESMNDADKIFLIKCITNCEDCFIKQDKISKVNKQNEPLQTMPEPKEEVKKEIDTIEDFNQKELIRLKVWGIQIFVLMGIFIGALIVILMIILSSGDLRSHNAFINKIEAFYGYLAN